MYHTGSNFQEGLYFHEFCEWNSIQENKLSSVGFSVHRQPKVGWGRDYKESPMYTQYVCHHYSCICNLNGFSGSLAPPRMCMHGPLGSSPSSFVAFLNIPKSLGLYSYYCQLLTSVSS